MSKFQYIPSPPCVMNDGVHEFEPLDGVPPFSLICPNCFEHFMIISETTASEMGLKVDYVQRPGDGSQEKS